MGQYISQSGIKRFQFDDQTICDVVVPLKLDNGQNVALIAVQAAKLDSILAELQTLNATSSSNLDRVQSANDYTVNYTYLDAGTADERINTVVHASVSLSLTVTDTYAYAGSSGSYRLTSITRS